MNMIAKPQPGQSVQEEQIRVALNRHWHAPAAGDANAEHDIYDDDAIGGANGLSGSRDARLMKALRKLWRRRTRVGDQVPKIYAIHLLGEFAFASMSISISTSAPGAGGTPSSARLSR